MIFTLTPNPSVDIFAESAHSRARHARIGGKGVNVSRFLARLGRESVCLFTAGERLGRFIAGSLAEEGIAARPFYAAGCENRVNIKFTRDERELNGRGRTAVVRVHQREQKTVGAPFVRLFEVLFGNTALFRGVFENPFVVVRNSQPFTQFLGDLSAAAAELSR